MTNLMKVELANGSLEKHGSELGDHCLGSTPKYKRRRKVSVVRDFPKMCGPNVYLVHSNGEGNVVAKVENDSEGQEVMPSCKQMSSVEEPQSAKIDVAFASPGIPDLEEEMRIDVRPVGLSSPTSIISHSVDSLRDKGNPLGLNEKFRRRRVSAIRDFPPFCGPNVASSSNMVITLTETTGGREEFLEGDLHGSRIEKSKASYVKEVVPHSQYRNQDSKSSDNIFEDVREVVHGMMVGPYCLSKQEKSAGKEMAMAEPWKQEKSSSSNSSGSVFVDVREVVHGMMAGPYCPWKQEKSLSSNSLGVMKDTKVKNDIVSWRGAHKAVARKSTFAGGLSYSRNREEMLPPVSSKSSSASDARKRVKDTLRLFQSKCKKILQEQEAKSEQRGTWPDKKSKRIDLKAAGEVRAEHREVNKGKIIGAVPGVEVGDEFQYRVELALIGVHHMYQNGIEFTEDKNGKRIAISIVASGAYSDDMGNPDVLIYSGQGGNVVGKKKNPEDQKLETGNLALKNSISARNTVRVIRGSKEIKTSHSSRERDKVVTTYVYDGLYKVDRYYTEIGKHGKMVFMFELRREPGQPELPWNEMKRSKKFKKREGVCVDDISGGKESFPVCAVNTLDNEKPPSFTYITKMKYPDWYRPSTAKGCDCSGRCSGFRKCSCAVKNGGEIPYNHNGAIVKAKPIVYECGPWCKCPPSCYNRVAQRGLSIQLEIFKTKSRGWGVRSLSFIPSGTFICEYTGKVIKEKEAEQRANEDEYLFDIGRRTEERDLIDGEEEEGVYTIDAARYGNVGRFVNHSCSPNLYAQDVLYDHGDPRMPHVMLFASENIPSLQELTYDYNYSMNQIYDSNGNIKVKNCFCGSTCTGRMY